MKKIILLTAIILSVAGSAFAADPNSIPEPAIPDIMVQPATVIVDPNFMIPVIIDKDLDTRIITIKFYMVNIDRKRRSKNYEPVSDEAIWSWVNDPDFLASFQEVYSGFPRSVRTKIRAMLRTATWEDGRKVYDRANAERTR